MKAYKCDICGALFEMTVIPDIRLVKYTHGYGEGLLDLCPDCQKKLEDWMKKKVTANETD